MRIYVVNGFPESGKTTFERIIQKFLGRENVFIYSTIDTIKDLANMIGWDGKKDDRGRRLLSDLKAVMNQYNDYTIKEIADYLRTVETLGRYGTIEPIVFVDSREPKEIARIVREFNARTIYIKREKETEFTNSSDQNVKDYYYDVYIWNNKDLPHFGFEIVDFLRNEGIISDETIEVDLSGNLFKIKQDEWSE